MSMREKKLSIYVLIVESLEASDEFLVEEQALLELGNNRKPRQNGNGTEDHTSHHKVACFCQFLHRFPNTNPRTQSSAYLPNLDIQGKRKT